MKEFAIIGVFVSLLGGCSGGGETDVPPTVPSALSNGYACIDQVGRGQGDLLSGGDTPIPLDWPHQERSPVYVWGNTGMSESQVTSDHSHIRIDRDYYVETIKPGYVAYRYPHPLAVSAPGQGRTINAASCELTDVTRAVDLASDGATVVIPPGTCTWSATLTVTKAITLQGQGIGMTVLIDGVVNRPMISIDTSIETGWRVTGIEIRYDGGVRKGNQAQLDIAGASHAFRVDHNRFYGYPEQSHGIRFSGDLRGVIDHNVFDDNNQFAQAIQGRHESWDGVGHYGDYSWAMPDHFGTNQFVFIEDNRFEGSGDIAPGALDMFSGARVVFRHNTVNNDYVTSHGTESSQRERSFRMIEMYDNEFSTASGSYFTAFFMRGGTGVIYNNRYRGTTPLVGDYRRGVVLANFRDNQAYFPWGKCDGTSVYDENS